MRNTGPRRRDGKGAPERRGRLTGKDTRGLKVLLVAALFVGAVAYSGSGGSFSSFNAQVDNPGSSLASGTLTLNDTVNGQTAKTCFSWTGTSASDNTNTACQALFSLSNIEPGQWSPSGNTAQVAIENDGSLGASQFSFFAPAGAACHDTATTTSPVSNATYGSELNFVNAANNLLCQETDMFVQESAQVSGQTDYYCWFGAEDQTSGLCAQPMTASLGASISSCSSAGSVTLSSQPGTIAANDVLNLSSATANCQFTVTGGPYPPTTGSSVVTVTGGSYLSGSGAVSSGTVVNSTVLSQLSYSADRGTVSNFDSSLNKSQQFIQLYPITGPGTIASSGTEFPAQTARDFTIGLYISNPTSSDENNLQGLSLSFEIDWYVNQ